MSSTTLSTEVVRRLRNVPPTRAIDYRDPKLPGFVLRARPSGVHSWRVQLPNRRWLSLGRLEDVKLRDAREAAQRCRAKAALGEAPPSHREAASAVTLRAFLEEHYEPWMRATYHGRNGQVLRVRAVFKDFLDLQLPEISAARLDKWRSSRQNHHSARIGKRRKQIAGSTLNRDLAALQAALSRAVEWGMLAANPVKRTKRSMEDESAVVRYLSIEEEQRMLAALSERDEARRLARRSANEWRRQRGYDAWPEYGRHTDYLTPLVILALHTGLRRGELFQLRWRDIDLDRSLLTVRGSGAKSGQTRHVPLNSAVMKTLSSCKTGNPDEQSYVFGDGDTPLSTIKKSWAALLKAANVKQFRFHDLRHTFASKLVMAGVDLNTVRELLGHSTLAMTLRYAHLAPEHKASAVERLVSPSVSLTL